MSTEIVGWLSSALLVLTITRQIYEQWKKGTSKGVSPFLFIGQLAASTGFVIYSIFMKSPVFIVTNTLMMVSAMVGLWLVMVHRHQSSKVARGRSDEGAGVSLEGLRSSGRAPARRGLGPLAAPS